MEVTQEKVNRFVSIVEGASGTYKSNVAADADRLQSTFNELWISERSRTRKTTIEEVLRTQIQNVFNVMSNLDTRVRAAVAAFNAVEMEDISYSGYTWPVPEFAMNLNATLPNGAEGFLENGDMGRFIEDLDEIKKHFDATSDELVNGVGTVGMFGADDMTILREAFTSVNSQLTDVLTQMKNDIANEIDLDKQANEQLKATAQDTLTIKASIDNR